MNFTLSLIWSEDVDVTVMVSLSVFPNNRPMLRFITFTLEEGSALSGEPFMVTIALLDRVSEPSDVRNACSDSPNDVRGTVDLSANVKTTFSVISTPFMSFEVFHLSFVISFSSTVK